MHRTLPLVVALGLAACNQYGYVPTTNTSATVRGRPAADYQMPPENPTGDVQLATLGIAKLPAVMGATVDALHLSMVVTNNGKRAGDEVAELYLKFPSVPGAPIHALRAFQRVHLEPGASQKLHFDLQPRDVSMVTTAGDPIVAEGEYVVSVGGGQPHTGTQVLSGTFNIKGKLTLPE